MYLTVRDLKTGNRAEFVNKSDIINYINEKVFEGRDENYMVLEAYAGKYSIWLSNKEAAQGNFDKTILYCLERILRFLDICLHEQLWHLER